MLLLLLPMPTSDEIRRTNLLRLVEEHGTQTALADVLDVSTAQLNQWINGAKDSKTGKRRGISDDKAREIERAVGKPRGWLDNVHDAQAKASSATDTLAAAIVDLVAGMPPARWRSVRAQLDAVAEHPEMRDDVIAELTALLRTPTKQLSTGT